jgi:hypothetical protein
MSKTRLHSEKAKSKHGVYGDDFNDYPFKVKKYYDRHCGSNDNKVEKLQKKNKQDKKEFERLRNNLVDK